MSIRKVDGNNEGPFHARKEAKSAVDTTLARAVLGQNKPIEEISFEAKQRSPNGCKTAGIARVIFGSTD